MAEAERVIVVGATPPPRHGTTVMTELLVRSLKNRGLLAAHLETRDPRPLSTIGRFDATNVILGLRHAWALARLLRRHPNARVYVPISQARLGFARDAAFLLLARVARRGRIVHLHGGHFAAFYRDAGPIMSALIRTSLSGVEQAWVLSDSLRPMFDGLIPADRVHVIANAVDDPGVADAPRRTASAPGATRILFLANLLPSKGCFDLVAALASVRQQLPELELRLVGEGSPEVRAALERRSEPLRTDGIPVEVVGPVWGEDRDHEYRATDLFAFPTRYRYEGQPLVVLEAMAAGLPIITTTIGAIPDTIEDGANGLLVSPGNVEQLASAIVRLARDRGLRLELGRAARESYLARFRPNHFEEAVNAALRIRR